jgi:hypothetical protein
LRIRPEDVVDLGPLSVTQRLLIIRRWRIGVGLDLEVEERANKTLSGAEGGDDDGGLEELRGEELDREVLLRLFDRLEPGWMPKLRGRPTHNLGSRFAIVPNSERERSFKTRSWVL